MLTLVAVAISMAGALSSVTATATAGGGKCVLSHDGSVLYVNVAAGGETSAPELWAVELPSAKHKVLDMKWMGAEKEIVALAPYKLGRILIGTQKSLYWYDPAKGTADRFYVPKEMKGQISELAYDHTADVLLLDTTEELYVLPKGKDEFEPVNTRRAPDRDGISFAPNGTLLFGCHGDLWHGKVVAEEDEEDGKKVVRYSIYGYRYCPLATLETASMTPSEEGVRCTAFFDGKVYAEVNRLGGSGWGTLATVPPPHLGKPRGPDQEIEMYQNVAERAEVYRKALAGTKVLGGSGGRYFLSASGDGSTLFYLIERETGDDLDDYYVLKKGGKPVKVPLKFEQPK
ncbi:hypothetical protein DB346_22360 [Verrucomicrobia bacterium LW23]|nr:hypothetical protein DB346_22360 [Verrucomicrobia bacterium LW23]